MRRLGNSARSTRRARRSGFTLIEVLLVLAILVILAGLSVVAIVQVQGGASKAAKTQIAELEQSLDMYRLDVGSYPTSDSGLNALTAPPSDLKNVNKWKGPYVKNGTLPSDPWGNPYQYEQLNGKQYKIWSWGEDGQQNTQDDISNLTEV